MLKVQNVTNINMDLIQWFENFWIQSTGSSILNQQLAEELNKRVIGKCEKRKAFKKKL